MNLVKGNCEHCGMAIDFPPEYLNHHRQCRHCGKQTILKKTPDPIPEAAPVPEMIVSETPVVPTPIEDKLDDIGGIFFVCGIIGGVIAGIVLLVTAAANSSGADITGEVIALIFFAIVSIGQGIIIKTLFNAAAEHIRLTRQIAKK